jgi:hypothetical protein
MMQSSFRDKIYNTCHRTKFQLNKVIYADNYDPYGIMTLLKIVLMPLNTNDFHSPTIRCSLNVSGLLHK